MNKQNAEVDYLEYIESNTTRCEANHRGGGIEIDLKGLLNKDEDDDDFEMTAYQNYLGGGMLGRICNSYSFDRSKLNKVDQKTIDKVSEALNRYFHNLTNHDDEWESASFEANHTRPVSAY
jgi:hypothetical protein